MDTPPDPALKPVRLEESKQKLRRLARREPWVLRLLEPGKGPLLEAFLLGLAAGGYKPARRWVKSVLGRGLFRS